MSLLDRYVAGEHIAVWRELVAMGPRVQDDPVALEVARETMRRVQHNVQLVIERLRSEGWRFSESDVYAIWAPPHQETADQITELERRLGGRIPLALRTFWSVVGTVSLMRIASGPEQDLSLPDPLVIGPVDHALTELSEWETDEERSSENEPHETTFVGYLRIAFAAGGLP